MKCCPECFGDRHLRKYIIPFKSIETGRCSYCDSENVPILAPSQLSEKFGLLIEAYRPDPKGALLVQWFREDWGLFDHARIDDARAKNLLAEILDDDEIVHQTFSPTLALVATQLSEWEKLRVELMYHNRFFPDVNIDLEGLASLLPQLTLDLAVDTCASTDATKRFDWTNCAAPASNTYGNSVAPLYVVETLPPAVISATITEQWYRVTSRASGGSNQADVILQIMFRTP